MKYKVIGEVMTESPYGFKSDKSWEEQFEIAEKHCDIVSIYTDSRWGGSFEHLKYARSLTDKEILASGIHATDDDINHAIDEGANHVRVVGRKPEGWLRTLCWIEPLSIRQLTSMNLVYTDVVVWNTQNLHTGGIKYEGFDTARKVFDGQLIQSNGIRQVHDVHPDANGVIINEHIESFLRSAQML